MEINTGVYAVLNEVNGKLYVGSTARGFKQRWKQHQQANSCCRGLKSAINKYGVKNFSFHVLEYVDVADLSRGEAKSLLIKAEQAWIDMVVPFGNSGYNMLFVAGSHLGAKRSDACKAALSRAFKGKKHPAWRVEKNRQAQIGKIMSAESSEKKKLSMIGRISPMKGRKHSEEAKLRIRANGIGKLKPRTKAHSAKLSAALRGRKSPNKGVPLTEEVKAKLRAAMTGRVSPRKGVTLSEETRGKIRKKVLGFKHSEEAKVKIKAAALRQWQKKKT